MLAVESIRCIRTSTAHRAYFIPQDADVYAIHRRSFNLSRISIRSFFKRLHFIPDKHIHTAIKNNPCKLFTPAIASIGCRIQCRLFQLFRIANQPKCQAILAGSFLHNLLRQHIERSQLQIRILFLQFRERFGCRFQRRIATLEFRHDLLELFLRRWLLDNRFFDLGFNLLLSKNPFLPQIISKFHPKDGLCAVLQRFDTRRQIWILLHQESNAACNRLRIASLQFINHRRSVFYRSSALLLVDAVSICLKEAPAILITQNLI